MKYYIGIDLGGTTIKAGLVDENGKIIHKNSVPTRAEEHYSSIIKDMANLCFSVVSEAGHSMEDVVSIGVGSPGTCDVENGILLYTNNINFDNVPLVSELNKLTGKPVRLENDANCAALGEATWGAAKGTRHSVTITLGTGVGGGIIIDGKIYGGFNHAGAEVGHSVIVVDGESCTCGRRGCFEAYASATALKRITLSIAHQNKDSLMWEIMGNDTSSVDGRTAFSAAQSGDKAGQEVVNTYIKYLSEGIVNLVNIFQPEKLVIGGGISKEGDYLLKPIKEHVEKYRYSRNSDEQTELVVSKLGNDAGIIGAAML